VQSCSEQEQGSWGQTRVCQENIQLDDSYTADPQSGAGVVAYIVDTGILTTHNDFQGRATFGFKAESGWSNSDGNGHGTHVASTVGGKKYGIAKKVELVAVKVLGDNGSGSWAGVIAGIDYVADQHQRKGKPSTANLSLGGARNQAINLAVDAAVDSGVVFVVAAGNDNGDACLYSPASAPKAISVGATDIGDHINGNEVDIRSYFSNYGTCTHIYAPGSLITAAWIGSNTAVNTISGTSMASPHVCGLACLLLGVAPSLKPAEVKHQLQQGGNQNMIDMQCEGARPVCSQSPNILAYNGCQI